MVLNPIFRKIFEKINSMNSNKIKHFIPNFLLSCRLIDIQRKDLQKNGTN